ncbi:platelet glycoprotein V [Phyllopteryx taeniolatus]|uniref:platelet glycoprotein V n=1 Tax=Phyllopteryx taeniolatus TaxID=161469 RepID=UPI002AD405C0|nr:platelet glycoprotein V [Phyllopteryx taeniolatus]
MSFRPSCPQMLGSSNLILPAGAFGPLSSLELLVLDNNLLSTLRPAMFGGLGVLQELYLRNNDLDHLPSDTFKDMPRLSQLALSGNLLKAMDGNMLAQIPSLKKLHLHNNSWLCDCNIVHLVQWMKQTNVSLSPQEALKCESS